MNAANTQQDLQAAAAYWAAACKAVSAVASAGSAEELLQLQQNDQIEITRLPASNGSGSGSNAQDLPNNNNNNTKSKQQKCPVCPYISESKSQMNYHVSLHKPTQYECRLCTFVCAKKQHLSSHMRSVHQQQLGSAPSTTAAGGLDFSVALQLAAAKQIQQMPPSMPLPAIDLNQLTQSLDEAAAAAEVLQAQQQLPPEYQYKLISYCPRCPARFAQKHNDERNAKLELEQHLAAHAPCEAEEGEQEPHVCTYCEYRAGAETLLQLHRAVHMSHYQEKCQELYRNCKEDVTYPAPKLLQISGPETIWVVDNELGAQLLRQNAAVSSSTGSYDGANSLLKKQLESGTSGALVREQTPPKTQAGVEAEAEVAAEAEVEEDEEEQERQSSSTPSTSASVATSDLAADASSDAGSMDTMLPPVPPAIQRCQHCPFETEQTDELQQHMQKHACISQASDEAQQCAHCDYNCVDEAELEQHTAVHFNASEKLKSVDFFTCYDKLEISVEQEAEAEAETETETDNKQPEHNNNQDNVVNANVQQQTLEPEQEQKQPEEPSKKHSTKLILYKNDGALSVKSSTTPPPPSEETENGNISDRLRRRSLRGTAATTAATHASEAETPDKMILVNAKTGKVIFRK